MINDLINTWKLNKTLLAKRLGISKGYFNNKLNRTASYKFTELELTKMKEILKELQNDIEKFIKNN